MLVKQCDEYIKEREEDLCELHDRISAIKEDLKDPKDVFQYLYNSSKGTLAGDHFLSILQHLLFIRDDPVTKNQHYRLIDECMAQLGRCENCTFFAKPPNSKVKFWPGSLPIYDA